MSWLPLKRSADWRTISISSSRRRSASPAASRCEESTSAAMVADQSPGPPMRQSQTSAHHNAPASLGSPAAIWKDSVSAAIAANASTKHRKDSPSSAAPMTAASAS